MNNVQLLGYVTRDPDLRYTKSGSAVCQFTLAVDKGLSKDKKAEFEASNRATADFPRIVAWNKLAENAGLYLQKGSQVCVNGRIETGSYTDKDGKRVFTTDVLAFSIEFLNNIKDPSADIPGNSISNKANDVIMNSQDMDDADFFDDDFEEIQDDRRIPF